MRRAAKIPCLLFSGRRIEILSIFKLCLFGLSLRFQFCFPFCVVCLFLIRIRKILRMITKQFFISFRLLFCIATILKKFFPFLLFFLTPLQRCLPLFIFLLRISVRSLLLGISFFGQFLFLLFFLLFLCFFLIFLLIIGILRKLASCLSDILFFFSKLFTGKFVHTSGQYFCQRRNFFILPL